MRCSLGYFRFTVILGFIFILSATVIGTLLPVWEGRHLFAKVRETLMLAASPA